MNLIREDEIGLYVAAGGYIARPVKPTSYKVGERVKTHHFGGSVHAGVGKLPGRNKYKEFWMTTGVMSYEYKKKTMDEQRASFQWYKDFA